MVPHDSEAFKPSNQFPGDMFMLDLQDETLMVQLGIFVGSAITIEVDTGWSEARPF